MYLIDYHNHSLCSPDGNFPLTEMAQAAIDAGIAEQCLTDHWDLISLDGKERHTTYDWTGVLEQMAQARAALEGKIVLRMGLELGSANLDPAAATAALQRDDLDFVIGSIHNLSPAQGGADFSLLDYPTPESCYAVLDDYFNSMSALAPLDCYDVLGHIIYPLRYFPARFEISLARYWDQITDIVKTAIAHGKGIEVNTWRGRTVEPWRPVLELYRSCGGELITTGSDAHAPAHVGQGIAQANALLAETGFRYKTVYRGRKPQMIPT